MLLLEVGQGWVDEEGTILVLDVGNQNPLEVLKAAEVDLRESVEGVQRRELLVLGPKAPKGFEDLLEEIIQGVVVDKAGKELSFREVVARARNTEGWTWESEEGAMAGGQRDYYSFDYENASDAWNFCVVIGSSKEMATS